MAIRELITLEGVDEVKRRFDEINVAGEQSLQQFRDLGQGGGFDEITKGAKDAGTALGDLEEGSSKAHTALTALRSVSHLLGVDMSSLASLGKIAGVSLEGAFAVAAAAAAVGIGKLEEAAVRIRGELDDLTKGHGAEAFANLSEQAKQFGTSVTALAPGLEAFQSALNNVDRAAKGFVALKAEDLPAALQAPNINAVSKEYAIFLQLLRAGRQTQDEAEKTATSFFNALKQGGVVTKQMVESLPTGTINLLKEALGAAGQSNAQFFASIEAGAVTVDKLAASLAAFGPQAQKAFDTKAIKTMGDEFGKLLAQLSSGIDSKAFSDSIIAGLQQVTQFIITTKRELDALIAFVKRVEQATEITGLGPAVRAVRQPGAIPGPTFEETAAAFAAGADIPKQTTTIQANSAVKKENAAITRDLAAATRDLAAAMNQSSQAIQQAIDAESISVDEGIKRLNALHDAAIEARNKPVVGAAAGPPKLPFIDVSEAEKLGTSAAASFGKGWVNAVQSNVVMPTTEALTTGLQDAVKPDFFRSVIETIFGPDTAKKLFDPIKQAIPEAQQEIVSDFKQTGVDSGINFSAGVQQTPPDFSGWIQSITNFGNAAVSQAQQIYSQIQAAFSQPIQISGQFTGPLGTFTGGGSGEFLAGGGRVRGPGTATSDSILAFLSRGEFVVNARATEMFLPLLHAINAGRLPPDFIGRFSMGGLARALSANKFAGGGQVQTAGSSHTFVLPSGQTFEATLTDQTVARLKRYSVKARMASTGRKPGWVT
jgi:hypothetical protein